MSSAGVVSIISASAAAIALVIAAWYRGRGR